MNTALNSLVADEDFIPLSEECLLTPDGYGFSSSAERILTNSKRGEGYYLAKASDRIIDVMEGITNGDQDVALVFDEENSLLGIFTESDYIKVRFTHDG
jgi:hypothetical protein